MNDREIKVMANKFSWEYLRQNKLICWSTGPTDPTLSKNKTMILQNFGQLAFFKSVIFCFLKKKEIKYNKYINNQNQEEFIVIIINYTFSVILLRLLCKIIFF